MFLTIEGLDGAGKDASLERIENRWLDVNITQEPSELWTGRAVRRVLKDENSHPLTDFYLFMADRVHHIEQEVRPYDEAGQLVVSGRYADSTRAYQPVALTDASVFESQWHAKSFIEGVMRPWNHEPDLTLYLAISVDTAIERSSGEEKYEKREFLTKVRKNYEALCEERGRIVRIDAERPKRAVTSDVIETIESF